MRDIKNQTRSSSSTNRIPVIRSSRLSTDRDTERDHRGTGQQYRDRDAGEHSPTSDYNRNLSRRVEDYENIDRHSYMRRDKGKTKSGHTGILYFIVFIAVLALGSYLFTYKWNKATVSIKVRSAEINQNSELILNNASTTIYEINDISETDTTEIKKSNSIDVKSKAKGSVTIYNNFDTHPQKLLKNTRLEAPDGKIYRIAQSIIVPGKTSSGSGSITVMAIADTYGSEYNMSINNFTISGFKGTPKYHYFSAKSNGEMSGGDMGKKYIISDQDIRDVEAKLAPGIEAKIREKLKNYKNDNYVIVRESLYFSRSNNRLALEKEADKKIYEQTIKGSFLIIKKTEISKIIAKANLSEYNGIDNIELANFEDLKIFTNKDFTLATNSVSLSFEYKGNIKWVINPENIKNDLTGKNISDLANVMSKYAGIDAATPSFRPIWSHTFPTQIDKIVVKSE